MRRAFTAIELLVVLGIAMLLMAMTVPGLVGAYRKGTVSDAAASVARVNSQARQLARSRQQANLYYGVLIVRDDPVTHRSYAAVTYGPLPAVGEPPVIADILKRPSTGEPVCLLHFNRNVTVSDSDITLTDNGINATIPKTKNVGFVYSYRTGYPVIGPGPVPKQVNVMGMALQTIDGRVKTAIDFYQIGLSNTQEVTP